MGFIVHQTNSAVIAVPRPPMVQVIALRMFIVRTVGADPELAGGSDEAGHCAMDKAAGLSWHAQQVEAGTAEKPRPARHWRLQGCGALQEAAARLQAPLEDARSRRWRRGEDTSDLIWAIGRRNAQPGACLGGRSSALALGM
ncbi:MAG: hypothetical protein H5T86_05445 [Armatimonadetes bacterium]|nr:hypothetical protein [Armatimonadota bacterium]